MKLAKGTALYIETNTPGTYAQVVGVKEFNPPAINWATEDTTVHDTATPVTTVQPTVRTNAAFELTLLYNAGDTYHALLKSLAISGAARNFKLVYPGSTLGTYSFPANVTGWSTSTGTAELHKATFTLTPTGTVTDALPVLGSVTVVNTDTSLVTGDVLTLRATFDEHMKVTGTPRIAVVIGANTRQANYSTGTGTNVLTFTYTIVGGDSATATNLDVSSPINLNGGTITDMLGQAPASLAFSIPNTNAFTVN